MGCYNIINAKCPTCGSEIEYQSKGGSCSFEEFSNMAVPIEDAIYIQDSSKKCINCGEIYTIYPTFRIDKIAMVLYKS